MHERETQKKPRFSSLGTLADDTTHQVRSQGVFTALPIPSHPSERPSRPPRLGDGSGSGNVASLFL